MTRAKSRRTSAVSGLEGRVPGRTPSVVPSTSFPIFCTIPSSWRVRRRAAPVQHLASGLHHALDPTTTGSGIAWNDLGVLAL
jgi:hypothetical protein